MMCACLYMHDFICWESMHVPVQCGNMPPSVTIRKVHVLYQNVCDLIFLLFLLCFRFLEEVVERIEMLQDPQERMNRQYEDHAVFKQEHDEQLVLWTQRLASLSTN